MSDVMENMAGRMPDAVKAYLAHTVDGKSIRSLARDAGCHASTILRQVRRYEQRRDDPLVDHALRRLGGDTAAEPVRMPSKGTTPMTAITAEIDSGAESFETEALRVLRRLAEPGACLAVAEAMFTAVIVREGADGNTVRTGTVGREIAEGMALREWIATRGGTRVVRYRVTAQGRTALQELMAREEARVRAALDEDPREGTSRPVVVESPLAMLARRRDKDGQRFLSADLVRAGERLREEFELAAMAGAPTGGWESLLDGTARGDATARGSEGALVRLSSALADLGPGLGDVALRVCCQLEGLETVEKRMGWAARSGKIVLRIGLQRLARHFEANGGAGGGLVG